MSREDHWYVPGKHEHEKQHIHEHETIQVLQNHAQYGRHDKFYTLLLSIHDQNKRNDICQMCGYKDINDAMEKSLGEK